MGRMDELGIATLMLVASDVHHHGTAFDVSTVTARWEEAEDLARRFPGRFAALWGIDPSWAWRGSAGPTRRSRSPGWWARTSTPTASTGRSTTPTTTRSTPSAPGTACPW